MDQKKVGYFLKELRKEKGITQEKLAEILGVSGRTVSRWETGFNMPDIDILIQISDYYHIDIREILDGERKGDKMNKDIEETVLKVADYNNEEKLKLVNRMHRFFIAGTLTFIAYFIMILMEPGQTSHLYDFISGMTLGTSFGVILLGVIATSHDASRIRELKLRLLRRQ